MHFMYLSGLLLNLHFSNRCAVRKKTKVRTEISWRFIWFLNVKTLISMLGHDYYLFIYLFKYSLILSVMFLYGVGRRSAQLCCGTGCFSGAQIPTLHDLQRVHWTHWSTEIGWKHPTVRHSDSSNQYHIGFILFSNLNTYTHIENT